MPIPITGAVTGTSQTGLTSPTYTLTADAIAPAPNGKTSYVSAIGGTQAGVTLHSGADPFTVSVFRPAIFKVLNYLTSTVLRKPPRNTWKINTRKGVTFLSGQPKDVMMVSTLIDIPAGVELADTPNFRACLSCHIGVLNGNSAAVGDSVLVNSI